MFYVGEVIVLLDHGRAILDHWQRESGDQPALHAVVDVGIYLLLNISVHPSTEIFESISILVVPQPVRIFCEDGIETNIHHVRLMSNHPSLLFALNYQPSHAILAFHRE